MALTGALQSHPSRLRPGMTVQDAIIALTTDGNPGGVMATFTLATFHPDLGHVALNSIDRCGLSGMQTYLLLKQCGTPARATALLVMATELRLPTPEELIRDLEQPLSPMLQRALTDIVPQHVPAFAGVDLTLPQGQA